MRAFLPLLLSLFLLLPLQAQETLRLYPDFVPTVQEEVEYDAQGLPVSYRKVTDPSVTVMLPPAEKADGSAVLIFPGGALVSLSWDSEFRQIASWLNARGVAAIGVKYRLRTSFSFPRPSGDRPDNKFLRMEGKIYDYPELVKANTNPAIPDPSDHSMVNAADDALAAMSLVLSHAAEWGIDPSRIGWMGFSAGGGVALAALMEASPAQMPAFLCSVYGPSLVDVTVPENAPALYVAVHADHPNVAAGCMALFMEWKKAGADAEIHVYDAVTGGFFGGPGAREQYHTPEGFWLESFYSWMRAHRFAMETTLE